jgi:hypothetical protein
MTSAPADAIAWVVAVNMGYGHQRTAYPLRDLAPEGVVLLANDYPGIPEGERAHWERLRRFYEFISNAERLPLVGDFAFRAFDTIQRILHFYPKRDLSHPDWNVRKIHSQLHGGLGRDLIHTLRKRSPILPIVTSFYLPALAAEFYDYPGDICCVICDADIARAWAPVDPRSSRITYFAPTRRVVQRLGLYGVRSENIFLTGYPLPMENVGGEDFEILKGDLSRRLANLDPKGAYFERYGSLIRDKLGEVPTYSDHPLTILFSIGGAGAQKDIGVGILRSLGEKVRRAEAKVILSAGIKTWVRDYLSQKVVEIGLVEELGRNVEILFAADIDDYFRQFSQALRKTDVLWTKPSELSFYTALGLPIVMAPPLGSQEQANKEWLLQLGSGIAQEDPAYASEWFFDLLESGWFAEAAMQGFVEGEQLGSLNIRRIVERNRA